MTTTADFLIATRDMRVVDHKRVLNETSKGEYFFLSKMFMDSKLTFKGGKKLKDFVQGSSTSSGGFYNPHDAFSIQIKDGLHPITVPWAFHSQHYATVDEEAELNDGDPAAFVDYVMAQEGGCVVDAANTWEESLFALPYKERMEDDATSQNAQRPYSILSLITRDGLAPTSSNGGVASGSSNWTTVQGINPTTNIWWKNQFKTYSASDPNAQSGGLISSFDSMVEKVKFASPDMLSQYVSSPERQSKVIITSEDGVVVYKEALRSQNDRMAALNDPSIRGPQYEGIPVKRVTQLDSLGWTAGNPDYLWLDMSVVKPFFHKGYFFKEKVVDGGVDHPNKTVCFKFTRYNIVVRSRRRLGRVYAA